jgi:HSP20 family protein
MANVTRYSPLATRWPAFEDLFTTLLEPGATRWTEQSLRLEVSETPEAYVVKADVAGVPKDQIVVNVNEHDVTISTEFKEEKETNGTTLLSERLYGKASRSIRLPQPVDTTASSATHVDGVLRLSLPKRVANGGSRLTIN